MNSSNQTTQDQQLDAPLTLFHRAELWTGRFAMLGFMTTAIAIAFKFTIERY